MSVDNGCRGEAARSSGGWGDTSTREATPRRCTVEAYRYPYPPEDVQALRVRLEIRGSHGSDGGASGAGRAGADRAFPRARLLGDLQASLPPVPERGWSLLGGWSGHHPGRGD